MIKLVDIFVFKIQGIQDLGSRNNLNRKIDSVE